MPLQTKENLNLRSIVVRDETQKYANTANRVGTLFEDIVDSLLHQEDIPTQIQGLGIIRIEDQIAGYEVGLDKYYEYQNYLYVCTTDYTMLVDAQFVSGNFQLIGLVDAPSDGGIYSRTNGSWSDITNQFLPLNIGAAGKDVTMTTGYLWIEASGTDRYSWIGIDEYDISIGTDGGSFYTHDTNGLEIQSASDIRINGTSLFQNTARYEQDFSASLSTDRHIPDIGKVKSLIGDNAGVTEIKHYTWTATASQTLFEIPLAADGEISSIIGVSVDGIDQDIAGGTVFTSLSGKAISFTTGDDFLGGEKVVLSYVNTTIGALGSGGGADGFDVAHYKWTATENQTSYDIPGAEAGEIDRLIAVYVGGAPQDLSSSLIAISGGGVGITIDADTGEIEAGDKVMIAYAKGVVAADPVVSGGPAVENTYATVAAMFVNQSEQTAGSIQKVNDAINTDFNIASGYAYFEYLGTTNGDYTDYIKISEQESMDIDLFEDETVGDIQNSDYDEEI
jgi:hypothetical protein